MSAQTAFEILGFCATVLGSTWYLSAKIERVATTVEFTRDNLKEHISADEDRFEGLHNRIDRLTPPGRLHAVEG